MKKIVFFFVIGLISFNIYSQSESKTVMIKSVETYGSFAAIQKNIHIIDENGENLTIKLENHNTKGIPTNMATLKSTLDKYLNSGFKLIASDAVSFGWNGVFTIEHTYIMQKSENN